MLDLSLLPTIVRNVLSESQIWPRRNIDRTESERYLVPLLSL